MNMMVGAGIQPDRLEKMRQAYASDVAILAPEAVASIIRSGGFETSVPFYQAGLIHAWVSKTSSNG